MDRLGANGYQAETWRRWHTDHPADINSISWSISTDRSPITSTKTFARQGNSILTVTSLTSSTWMMMSFNSAKDVQKLLRDLHMVDVSISTIKRQRACLGCCFSKPSNAQMVRNVNQEKRLLFCQSLMEEGHVVDTFNHVIFTNETIHLHQNCTISFCKIGEQQPYKIRPKHTAKLNVWAGISRRGAIDFLVFNGKMDVEFYCYEILVETLQPFIEGTYPCWALFCIIYIICI